MQGCTIKTPEEVTRWFAGIDKSVVSCDCETTSLKYRDLDCIGVSLCDGKKSVYIDLIGPVYRDIVAVLRKEVPQLRQLVFHNAPFDMSVLWKLGIPHTEKIVCTETAAHLLDENGEVGLKYLAQHYLNVPDNQIMTYEEASAKGLQSEEFYTYARHDAEWTWALWMLMAPRLVDEQLDSLFYDVEMPFQFVLRELQTTGVFIDINALSRTRRELHEEMCQALISTCKAGNIRCVPQTNLLGETSYETAINLGSPKQLSSFIVHRLGVPLEKSSDSDNYSVDKHVLEKLSSKHKFFECLLNYRTLTKLSSAFLEKLPTFIDNDGRIRASFHNCGTHTGRLSSSKPNMQQLPRRGASGVKVRSLIVAPPGYKLVCADYSGQELRVLAEVSRDLTMIEAFIRGQDLHLTMANIIGNLGIPDSLLLTAHPQHQQVLKKHKEQREAVKPINFGIAYGKTAVGFAKDWNVSEAKAQETIDAYFERFPRIKDAMDRCHSFLKSQGYVVNLAGRRRRLNPAFKKSYRQAFNFLIQGFSADLVKKAAGRVYKLCLSRPEWDCRCILQVHDELVYEIKEQYCDEGMTAIRYELEHAWELSIPMLVDIHCGNTYFECK